MSNGRNFQIYFSPPVVFSANMKLLAAARFWKLEKWGWISNGDV